ncbi:acyl carrier protein [Pseudomonas zeae]|uniref:Acyl carrier protein n=1 Tax=Pseudomonas zeae TaxID=2745510 RepID=A0A9E6TEA6_9PSED|nr:acyl carrier protein [Pseudomonas zeae]QXI14619.1 acyl carrier protein [Pseudomonas zeae]
MDDLEQRVRALVADHLRIDEDQVKNESSFVGDLGMDPVGRVELVNLLGEEFGVSIEDSVAETFTTVQDAIVIVVRYLKANQ